jgi:hypothetical protein
MKRRPDLPKWLRSPWIRYGAMALALGCWTYGLAEQLHSSNMTMAYLAVSGLILAVARL